MSDPNYTGGGAPEGLGWSSPSDLVGHVLAERYRVDKVIGDGGMGSVYLAEHVTLRKRVALKVLHPDLCRDQTHVDRFLQEARAASMIDHDHIVDIVDFGPVPGGSVFFAMEFLEGEDLSGRLRKSGRMPWPKVRELMLQIVGALEAAHDKGIIHRDLKPANCFVIQKRGRDFIKLLDFGIAKVTDEANDKGLTRTGAVFGTAKYMAPEQACGEPADRRTDVYAAAVVMYELLTGHVPFDGDNFMRVLSRHLTEALTLPSTMAPDANIPPVVESIVVKALSKKREDRFQSMHEFAAALEAVGPDGNLRGDLHRPGPPMMPHAAAMDDGPGHTMWMGQSAHANLGPSSQPPEGPRGTLLLDDMGGRPQFGEIPQGPVGWAGPATPSPPPQGTYVMDAHAHDRPQGGYASPITANPPLLASGPAPAMTPPTSPPRPETRPPTLAPDATYAQAPDFEPERRSKAGFVALLVGGAVAAIGAGGLVAWLVLGGDDAADEGSEEPPAKVAKAEASPVFVPEPEPEPQPEPEPEPEPEPKVPEPQPEPQPEIVVDDPDPPPEPTHTTPKPKPDPTSSTHKPTPKPTVKEQRSDKDIEKGFAKAMKSVKACAQQGAVPGQRITVDVGINKEGRVISAAATGKDRSTPVGQCVAQAVKNNAKFPKSEQALQTEQHTFKM